MAGRKWRLSSSFSNGKDYPLGPPFFGLSKCSTSGKTAHRQGVLITDCALVLVVTDALGRGEPRRPEAVAHGCEIEAIYLVSSGVTCFVGSFRQAAVR